MGPTVRMTLSAMARMNMCTKVDDLLKRNRLKTMITIKLPSKPMTMMTGAMICHRRFSAHSIDVFEDPHTFAVLMFASSVVAGVDWLLKFMTAASERFL